MTGHIRYQKMRVMIPENGITDTMHMPLADGMTLFNRFL
jgi:hypothetical protein